MAEDKNFTVTEGQGYYAEDVARYNEVFDGTTEQQARLKEIETEMNKLTTERTQIFNDIAALHRPAKGWEIEKISLAHGGRAHVTYKRTVSIEKAPAASTKTALELVLEKVDAKTLLHSNVLNREEKRTLLGLPVDNTK